MLFEHLQADGASPGQAHGSGGVDDVGTGQAVVLESAQGRAVGIQPHGEGDAILGNEFVNLAGCVARADADQGEVFSAVGFEESF